MNFDALQDGFRDWSMQTFDFPKKAQAEFLDDVAALLESNVKELTVFSTYVENYSGPEKLLAKKVVDSIVKGGAISEGFKGFLSPEIVVTLSVAEEQGVLPEAMCHAAEYLRVSAAGIGLFLKKCIYPFVFVVLGTALAAFMDTKFYPLLKKIMPYETWPASTQLIYSVWSFVLGWLPLILLTIIFIIVSLVLTLRNWKGSTRLEFDNWPLFNQYRLQKSAVLLKTLGLLLKNNVTLLKAVQALQINQPPYIQWHLQRMQRNIVIGIGVESDYLDTGLFSSAQIARLRILNQADNFEVAMQRMGDQTLVIVKNKLEKAAARLSSILFIFGGFVIGSVPMGYMPVAAAIGS